MKPLQTITIFILSVAFISCKKDKDTVNEPPRDWSNELKNTVWAGTYNHILLPNDDPMPFSIVLGADTKVMWSDIQNTRSAGNFKMSGDTVSIKFPSNVGFSAIVSDKSWSQIKSTPTADFVIHKLSKATLPDPLTLNNTTWNGSLRGYIFKIAFTGVTNLQFTIGTAAPITVNYTVEGSGIRFSYTFLGGKNTYYFIFQNEGKTMSGMETLPPAAGVKNYHYWTATKQ